MGHPEAMSRLLASLLTMGADIENGSVVTVYKGNPDGAAKTFNVQTKLYFAYAAENFGFRVNTLAEQDDCNGAIHSPSEHIPTNTEPSCHYYP